MGAKLLVGAESLFSLYCRLRLTGKIWRCCELSNRRTRVVLQEALEPHYIHQMSGKRNDNDVVIQSVIGNGNR